MRVFKTNEIATRAFKMSPGDVFSTAKLRKGFEELRKLYGQFGYIGAVLTLIFPTALCPTIFIASPSLLPL